MVRTLHATLQVPDTDRALPITLGQHQTGSRREKGPTPGRRKAGAQPKPSLVEGAVLDAHSMQALERLWCEWTRARPRSVTAP